MSENYDHHKRTVNCEIFCVILFLVMFLENCQLQCQLKLLEKNGNINMCYKILVKPQSWRF